MVLEISSPVDSPAVAGLVAVSIGAPRVVSIGTPRAPISSSSLSELF